MSKRLLVIGAGGHGRVAAEAAELAGWPEIAFLDDRVPVGAPVSGRWAVAGAASRATDFADHAFFVAVGDAKSRRALCEQLLAARLELVTLVHPAATLSPYATCGAGVLFCAGAIANVDSHIGNGVIVNTGATVDHDCRLGDYSHICPGVHLAGNVTVAEEAWVGIGASVKQGVTIGPGAVVGAGAAVLEDVPAGGTVVGVPARLL